MEKTFKIDFFELMFLAEACIPPRPIARISFWDNLTDVYYEQLSDDQRRHAWEWIGRIIDNQRLEGIPDWAKDKINLFLNRYNPNNQYIVTTVKGDMEVFLHDQRYFISSRQFIDNKHIIKVKPL